MKIYKQEFYLPVIELDSFRRFFKKFQKNVPGATAEYSEPYKKIFRHSVRDEEGYCLTTKQFHEVVNVIVETPVIRDWFLVATFKHDLMYVTNPMEELKPINPEHGKTYKKCDVCGHNCKNSYLIRNVVTNEELQVGCECVKKFGIAEFDWISKFTRELNRIYDLYISDKSGECSYWFGPVDKSAFAAIDTTLLFNAAIQHYKETKGKWKSGYYDEYDKYVRSQSNITIQSLVHDTNLRQYPNLISAIKNHVLKMDASSEFQEKMKELCSAFYCTPSDAPYAFFSIKYYIEYLKSLRKPDLPELYVGDDVYVTGEIVDTKNVLTTFGTMIVHKILTTKGYSVERCGVIPIEEKDNKQYTKFYSTVRNINKFGIQLDRATKNPKRGKNYIEL